MTIDTSCVSRRVESWELQWVTYRAVVLLTAKIQGSVLPLHYSPSFSKHEFCFQWSRNVFPTLCVYNLLVVTVLRPKDDVGAEFCIWFLTRCSAAGRLVVGLHTSLAPLTVARELQNRKCWTDELQQRPHFIRSIRKWTEASTSVPCGQLLLGLIWKVIGIDFEFVELFRVT